MRNGKSYKYKNYGPIPQNEYRTDNSAKSTDTEAVWGVAPQAGNTEYRQRLIKRQAQHPSGRRGIRGWSRTWKVNGWRAEAAALHDEISDMEEDTAYV